MQLEALKKLFKNWSGKEIQTLVALPPSGSDRRYFRINYSEGSAIGVYNANRAENEAFVAFTRCFSELGISVPQLYAENLEEHVYLLEDLGDQTLLQQMLQARSGQEAFPESQIPFYQQALSQLAHLQIQAADKIDYSLCYPTAIFDQQSMLWDCNQFKYWYLQPTKTTFNERALETDFRTLTNYLMQAPADYFMFRDFQARNIMLKEDKLYLIDYQGGRKGPLQYDVVSLLFQAKADLPNEMRAALLNHYIREIQQLIEVDVNEFRAYYYGFVLLRTMQVLGAYGFKGYYQRKAHFLNSIPYALKNLRWWLAESRLPIELPELTSVLHRLVLEEDTAQPASTQTLNIHLKSFAYKRGLPRDESGHGAGFVFDCRLVHNPGRYAEYKALTGLDAEVQNFLREGHEMAPFLQPIWQILEQAIEKYLSRSFSDLGINFGCTGGQHRSVFAAEQTLHYLNQRFGDKLNIHLEHREQAFWPENQ